MLNFLLTFALQQRAVVFLATLILLGVGVYSALHLPIDAVPDITPVQVVINTAVPGLAPEESEKLVTYPIESEMSGLPGMTDLRSLTNFGLSQVTLGFADGTDIFRARQLISERLQNVIEALPQGLTPRMAPISTGLGEVFYYTLAYKKDAPDKPATEEEQLMELRALHEYTVKPQLRATPGIAEVNSNGGYEKQLVISPKIAALTEAGMTLDELSSVISKNVSNSGGGMVSKEAGLVVVRVTGKVETAEEIANLPVKFGGGVEPMRVKDLADISVGHNTRLGAALENGQETVLGNVMMLAGENSRIVAKAVGEKLKEIQEKLPPGVEIHPQLDRSVLVDSTIHTVEKNLTEGAILVVVVLLVLLGNWRAALIVTAAIPLSFLIALTGMSQAGITGNLMSLGAVDFGLIVDGAVVMVENTVRRMAERRAELGRKLTSEERGETVLAACRQVVSPMFFGVLIITIVFATLLALSGVSGKMFKPMALTLIMALGGSLALSLTLIPALCATALGGGGKGRDNFLLRFLKWAYSPLLTVALKLRWFVLPAAAALCFGAWQIYGKLGQNFTPTLDEGSFSGRIDVKQGMNLNSALARHIQAHHDILEKVPEITRIFARIGTSEVATDPMPPNQGDSYLFYKPQSQWRKGADGKPIAKEELGIIVRKLIRDNGKAFVLPAVKEALEEAKKPALYELAAKTVEETDPEELGDKLAEVFKEEGEEELGKKLAEAAGEAGTQDWEIGQPIQIAFDDVLEGIKADVVVRIYGPDLEKLDELVNQAKDALSKVEGGEPELELYGKNQYLVIKAKREALLKYNIPLDELNTAIETALAGQTVGLSLEDNRRVDIVVRLKEEDRESLDTIKTLQLRVGDNGLVPLGQVADFDYETSSDTIKRDDGHRRSAVKVFLHGRDIQSYVTEAREAVRKGVELPPGYTVTFGGQFKNLEEARARLAIVVPAALGLILILIYLAFRSIRQTVMVATGIPLALTGGVVALWLRDMPFSITAAVGFIALSGVAVLNGLVLLESFNHLRAEGHSLRESVREGALARLRPVLMTALVAAFGFIPMAIATGAGAEVQRPLATVVIGGILTSTLLTLFVLPALYLWWEREKRVPVQ